MITTAPLVTVIKLLFEKQRPCCRCCFFFHAFYIFTFFSEREREWLNVAFWRCWKLFTKKKKKMLKIGWGKGKMYQIYIISIWVVSNELHWQDRLRDGLYFMLSNSFPVNLLEKYQHQSAISNLTSLLSNKKKNYWKSLNGTGGVQYKRKE